jgi:substrate import-associated zinc metallohydrolase lipoprotein
MIKKTLLFLSIAILAACSGKDDLSGVENIPGLGGDTWKPSALDKWLQDTLTKPYNIYVKYKWDQFEFELDKTLAPPREEKVIPALSAIKKVWIDTYVAEAGENFFKMYCPKSFILCGSASWNANGTITLGTAEGGRKVVIYLVNEFRTKDMPGYSKADTVTVKQMFHVIEHEFGHVLHQTVMYPQEFRKICAGFYSGNWNNISDANARRDGFVTAYAMSAYDEDFVEMISMMLVEGRDGFNDIVNSIPAGASINGVTREQAQQRLRQKEAMVVSYFKTVWKIDFYGLQQRTRKQIEQLLY